jgi:azurin
MYRIHAFLLGTLLVVSGCAQNKSQESSSGEPTKTVAAVASSAAAPPAPVPMPPEKVELAIGAVASTMTFDKTSLVVPAGAEVHLVLKDAKPGTLMHNWLLVRPGTEAAVAAAGLAAGLAGNYVTAGPDVIAYTRLAKPGGSSEVTFPAPPPGSYPYICSFPGHYLLMKGTLVVTPNAAAPVAAIAAATAPAFAEHAAKDLFTLRCSVCHGVSGQGDGPGAAALDPKPRAFSDALWQKAATDELIAKTIVEGGAAMSKSPGMPPNPDLASKPEVLKELVSMIRAFKKG